MEPIINPWWIYLASKSENVGFILGGAGAIIVICWILNIISNGEFNVVIPKPLKTLGVIMLSVGLLLPSKNTILTMMTLNYITPNNVEIIGDTVEDTIDYVVEKINEIIE